MNKSAQIDYFYSLSEVLTGYHLVNLYGTGQGDFYFSSLKEILGEELVSELLEAFQLQLEKVPSNPKNSLEALVKKELLKNDQWGDVCRNILKMWYMGNWYQMPDAWRENYVNSTKDVTKVLSTNSYKEGLVWKAMGKHPKSAKQPGFATWSFPPEINKSSSKKIKA